MKEPFKNIGKYIGYWVGGAVAALALQGCAMNTVNLRLDEKIASEPPVAHKKDLKAETAKFIDTATGLTEQQRTKLRSVREWINASIDDLDLQSIRLRSVLVKDVISENYDSNEVDLIKTRLKDISDRKLSVMFEAVRKVDAAMGHPDPNRRTEEDFVVYPAILVYPW